MATDCMHYFQKTRHCCHELLHLYTLVIDQWNQMRPSVAEQSFLFPCNVNPPIFFLSHIEHAHWLF